MPVTLQPTNLKYKTQNGTFQSATCLKGDSYILTAADKAEIAQQAAEEVNVPVQDVQVAGVSVLTDGVADVPSWSTSTPGVSRESSTSDCKNGNNARGVSVRRLDAATFYGLAKAAGADMASSSNPVGTYTDAAKRAIRKMLGIPNQEWELIASVTLDENSEEVTITTDTNGQAFELSKMSVRISLAANTTQTNNYFYTYVLARTNTDGEITVSAPTGRWPTGGAAGYCETYTEKIDDCVRTEMTASAVNSSNSQNVISASMRASNGIKCIRGFKMSKYNSTSSAFTTGTKIALYGIRMD